MEGWRLGLTMSEFRRWRRMKSRIYRISLDFSEAIQHDLSVRNKYDTATHFLLSTFILTFNTHVLIIDSHVTWQARFVINSTVFKVAP